MVSLCVCEIIRVFSPVVGMCCVFGYFSSHHRTNDTPTVLCGSKCSNWEKQARINSNSSGNKHLFTDRKCVHVHVYETHVLEKVWTDKVFLRNVTKTCHIPNNRRKYELRRSAILLKNTTPDRVFLPVTTSQQLDNLRTQPQPPPHKRSHNRYTCRPSHLLCHHIPPLVLPLPIFLPPLQLLHNK